MNTLEETREKVATISSNVKGNVPNIDEIITDLVKQYREKTGDKYMPVRDNQAQGISCILDYYNDYNYTEVEGVSIGENDTIYIDTNEDRLQLCDFSVEDKVAIADWLIDEFECPEDFGMEDELGYSEEE